MAKKLNKEGITTGGAIKEYHITQTIDAFSGIEAYDISLSGSLNVVGPINGDPNIVNSLNVLHAISASWAPGSGRESTTLFYRSSSANLNTITFYQEGDLTETLTIDTGSIDTSGFFTDASVDSNNITFYHKENILQTLTINTGSTDDFVKTATNSPITTYPYVPNNIEFTKGDNSTFNVSTGLTWITCSNIGNTIPQGSYGIIINYVGSQTVTLDLQSSNIGDTLEIITLQSAQGAVNLDYEFGSIKVGGDSSLVGGAIQSSTNLSHPTFKLVYTGNNEWHLTNYLDNNMIKNNTSIFESLKFL